MWAGRWTMIGIVLSILWTIGDLRRAVAGHNCDLAATLCMAPRLSRTMDMDRNASPGPLSIHREA